MKKRPFAVFDIDGTLIRWQLYHALADELARRTLLSAEAFKPVRTSRMAWKNRGSDSSFNEYERTLIGVIDATISTISVDDLRVSCQAVLDVYKDQVYTYTRDLMSSLRAKNYLLFTISASQSDIVKLLAEYYQFDDYGGSHYVVKDGYFTGEKDLLWGARKTEYLDKLVTKHDANWQGSVAVGDSEGDILLLSKVERPIAFNPTKQLFAHAREQKWPVVIERKNVIYQLEPHHGSYLLA
jgi:HAD superfamily hydrolase (TIGR01490 family)